MEKSSISGGVPAFSIGDRLVFRRERLRSFSDEERRWRAQFLKDQKLNPTEPKFSPEYYAATNNIFRRIYKAPFNALEKALSPVMGESGANTFRYVLSKQLLLIATIYISTYLLKYSAQDWTKTSSWSITRTRRRLLPGDPEYPNMQKMEPYQYCDEGFSNSPFFKGPPPSA